MKKRSSIIVILALFVVSSFTFSIYEDEIVHTDWYRENIGEVQTAFLRNRDSLLVSTAESVIASLDPKSGQLNWRQVLPNNETLLSFTQKSNYALSLSRLSNTLFIRLFDADQGHLLWDDSLTATSNSVSGLITDSQVIILASQNTQVRSLSNGNVIWQNAKQCKVAYGHVADSVLYVTAIDKDSSVTLISYNLATGAVNKEKSLGKFPEISQVVFLNGHLVFLAETVYIHKLTSQSNVAQNTQERARALQVSEDSKLLAIQGQAAQIVKVNEEKLEVVYTFKKGVPTSVGSTFAVTATSPSSLELVNLATKQVSSISDLGDRGHVTKLFSLGDYTLVLHQDLTLTMVSQTSLLWQREESLSYITDVQIMEFPSSHVFDTIVHTFDMHSNFITSFLSRVSSHIQQFTDFISGGKETEVSSALTKDRFGYRQLILAVTKAGKLFAMSTEKGNILWSKFFPGITIQHIFITKSVFPLEAILIGKEGTRTFLYVFNPLNGHSISTSYGNYNLLQANVLPGYHSAVLVDKELKVHVYPENSWENSTMYFYVVDSKETSVKGYSVTPSKSVNVWKIPFTEGETIVTVGYPQPDEHITAPYKITGDRKALPKYLNRNMVTIATVKGSKSDSTLNIYIVDTVTGDFIYHTYHPMSCGPVHIISSENWVGYHYWNIENSRYEYSVIELYEKEIDWKGTTFSSFSRPEVTAIQQSYVFLHGITTIGITKTAYGLSTKQILFGLESGQIAAISRLVLDARRPPKELITPEYYEEGLFPYYPWITFNKHNIINYYRKVDKLREIKTAPAYLESTSLVFAYGLDNFFTLMNPSGPFDVLGVNFNYFGLIATAFGIVGLTAVFMYLSKRKDLYRRWE